MSMLRTIKCDMPNCNAQETEREYGVGWNNWSIVNGICLTKPERPSDLQLNLCPEHTIRLADFIDSMAKFEDN